jgi:hypothetical protein
VIWNGNAEKGNKFSERSKLSEDKFSSAGVLQYSLSEKK